MGEPHVVTAFRAKRDEISGHVHDLERKLARHRANLANIDATIRLFAPELNPDISRQSGPIAGHGISPRARIDLDQSRISGRA